MDTSDTFADFLERLGHVPLDRIRMRPAPGTATAADVVRIEQEENRLCELIEVVLVEKAMGFRESLLAMALGHLLREFVAPRNLGLVTGPDGMMQLFPGLVRIPDVAFVSWNALPEGRVPDDPIPQLAPDLAVEVLSRTNTRAEMERKRQDYFTAGVDLVWLVDPDRRSVTTFTSAEESRELEQDTLDGGQVLPGFSLPLATLFAELDRRVG
jgi:Uma2 family endonuclease